MTSPAENVGRSSSCSSSSTWRDKMSLLHLKLNERSNLVSRVTLLPSSSTPLLVHSTVRWSEMNSTESTCTLLISVDSNTSFSLLQRKSFRSCLVLHDNLVENHSVILSNWFTIEFTMRVICGKIRRDFKTWHNQQVCEFRSLSVTSHGFPWIVSWAPW